MISTEQKLQLVHILREDHKKNRLQLHRREQILYGKNMPEFNYEEMVDNGYDTKDLVPYKGKVEDIIFQMIGGIRSGLGYCGAETIIDLQEKAKFVKITSASLKESHPHDITISKEAPNYSSRGDI